MILDFEQARLTASPVAGVGAWTKAYRAALEAQAHAAVRKYGRHIEGACDISVDTSNPVDSRCTCGLRETLEAK